MLESITVETIITICASIATILTAVGLIKKFSKEKISNISSEISKQFADEVANKIFPHIEDIRNQIKDLQEKVDKNQKTTDRMMMSTARYNINRAFDYYMKQGHIDDHSMFVLQDLYDRYEALGGNGQAKIQIENLRALYNKSCAEGKN